jgi:hypothetical protein
MEQSQLYAVSRYKYKHKEALSLLQRCQYIPYNALSLCMGILEIAAALSYGVVYTTLGKVYSLANPTKICVTMDINLIN